MLSINPVNFLRNNYYYKNNSISAPGLKPLAKDTVSFRGQRELTDIRTIVRDNANCVDVSKNAKIAENNLKKALNEEMSGLIASEINTEGIIEPIKSRIKDPNSIEEKVTSIIADGVLNDPSKVFQPKDQNSIKKHINDIVGARIILKQPEPEKNSPIIQTLIKMIHDEKIKVKKVEVITPQGDEGIKPYFTYDDLDELKSVVGHHKYNTKPSETGYSALHIDLDLSDENLPAKFSGYSGELQIMGPDVAYFKDLEDFCYKIKQGKSVPSGHYAYNTLVEHLNKYFKYNDKTKTDAENKKIANRYKALFGEYTRKAYIIQRKKDVNSPDYNYEHLPSLEDCAMAGQLPNDLDFNYLQKVKKYCDSLYDLSKRADLDEATIKNLTRCNNVINKLLVNTNQKTRNSITKTLDKLYQLTSCDNSQK